MKKALTRIAIDHSFLVQSRRKPIASSMSESQRLTLPDGRELAYGIFGNTASGPEAPTVLYFHGFPGSHHEAGLFAPAAARHGLRLIAPSRPGSDASSPHSKRRFADFAADVLALVDHLSVQRFTILAVSAGSPYALCLATDSALHASGR